MCFVVVLFYETVELKINKELFGAQKYNTNYNTFAFLYYFLVFTTLAATLCNTAQPSNTYTRTCIMYDPSHTHPSKTY